MECEYEPLGAEVIVRPIEKEQIAGVDRVDGNGRDRPTRGIIIAIGDGEHVADDGTVTILKPKFKIGDEVVFGKFDHEEVWMDGKRLAVMSFNKIKARKRV